MLLNTYVKNNFKAYDEQTTKNILSQHFRLKNFPNGKRLFLCVGADGAGKSTVIANLYKQKILDIPYISQDFFQAKCTAKLSDELRARQFASLATDKITQNLVRSGCSFCYETTLARTNAEDLVKIAKKNGYKILVFFVMTDSPTINVERVNNSIDCQHKELIKKQILECYNNINKSIVGILDMCDDLYMFDNSQNLTQTNDMCVTMDEERVGGTF